ncbi:hypothetical protein C1646_666269 [Rhizophagus diaphanus]|nr:hypothetical protein C1646_666269 [Rhizophagus diaphanus] [Rhizophagus sp. MUCL 43196]
MKHQQKICRKTENYLGLQESEIKRDYQIYQALKAYTLQGVAFLACEVIDLSNEESIENLIRRFSKDSRNSFLVGNEITQSNTKQSSNSTFKVNVTKVENKKYNLEDERM